MSSRSQQTASRVIPHTLQGRVITLWHGSPAENAESIMENGIMFRKHDAERRVDTGIAVIESKLGITLNLSPESRAYVVSRLKESEEKGGVVFVSGERQFATRNSLAGKEWLESLLRDGLRQKYPDMYEDYYRLRRAESDRLKELEAADAVERDVLKMSSNPDHDEYRAASRKVHDAYARYHAAQAVTQPASEKVHALEKQWWEQVVGHDAVLFRIEVPFRDLYPLMSEASKEHVMELEERLANGGAERSLELFNHDLDEYVGHALQEVTLTGLPPRYIKNVEPIVSR